MKEFIKQETERRREHSIYELQKIGIYPTEISENFIKFPYKDKEITFYHYKGWATGKSIKDCRGLKNLLKQLV